MKKDYFAVLKNVGHIIPVHVNIARAIGFMEAGFLTQLIYYSGAFDKETFNKTDAEISQETGLSSKEIRTAREKLISLGFISYQRKGIPARGYYTVFPNAVNEYLENKLCQNGEQEMPKGQTSEAKTANKQGQNGELLLNKQHNNELNKQHNTIEESEIKNFASPQDEIISFDENGNQIINDSLTEKTKRKQTGRAAFVPPTVVEVYDEAIQKGLTREEARFESSQFVNYYESIGWISGKKKIVSWKAAFAGWLNRSAKWNKERKADTPTETSRRDSYADIAEITINSLMK